MEDDLNVGTFAELTGPEAEIISGGSFLSKLLQDINDSVQILYPLPIIGRAFTGITDIIVKCVEAIAEPVYGWAGWKYR